MLEYCSSSSSSCSFKQTKRPSSDESLLPPNKIAASLFDAAALDKAVAALDSAVAADSDLYDARNDKVMSEVALARVLHEHVGFKCDGKFIFTCNGFIWSAAAGDAPLIDALKRFVCHALKRASDRDARDDDDDDDDDSVRDDLWMRTIHAIRKTPSFVARVVAACRAYTAAQESGFAHTLDANPRLLACTDGVVDLESGAFRAGTPADRIGRTCGHALGHLMRKSAAELLDDVRLAQMLQLIEAAFPSAEQRDAYLCLLASLVRSERADNCFLYVLHGGGRDFKSKTASLLAAMLGAYATCVSTTLLTRAPPGADKPRADLCALRGARLLLLSEPATKETLRADVIKRLLGDDGLAVRAPHSRHESAALTLRAHMLMTTNALPRLDTTPGDHAALVARLRFLHFPVRFFSSRDAPEYDATNALHKIGVAADVLLDRISAAAPVLLAYLLLRQPVQVCADPLGSLPSAVAEMRRYVALQARDTVLLWYDDVCRRNLLMRRDESSLLPPAAAKDLYAHFCDYGRKKKSQVLKSKSEFIARVEQLTGLALDRGRVSSDGTHHAKMVWRLLVWRKSLSPEQKELTTVVDIEN